MPDQHRWTHARSPGQHQRILLCLMLVVVSRAMVPPGYMPSPISATGSFSPFVLCGGDWQSAQLLDAWDQGHAMEHSDGHHSASHGHGFEFCDFDALSLSLAEPLSDNLAPPFYTSFLSAVSLAGAAIVLQPARANHLPRAPPSRFVSLKNAT